MPDVNLENDEKTKIREEEIYRSEVQKELNLQSPKKWYDGWLWKFLNAGIVLTLVGSVVATLFLDQLTKRKIKADNVIVAKKLKIEIVGRSSVFLKLLEEKNSVEFDAIKLQHVINEVFSVQNDTSIGKHFSEYANTSLASLLWELKVVSETNCFGDKIIETSALSIIENRNTISSYIANNWAELKLDDQIENVMDTIEFVLLVKFLDDENNFFLPPGYVLSQKLLDNLKSMRAECSQVY